MYWYEDFFLHFRFSGASKEARWEKIDLQGKPWLALLLNHPQAIAAMEFFIVPTVIFGVPVGTALPAWNREEAAALSEDHTL